MMFSMQTFLKKSLKPFQDGNRLNIALMLVYGLIHGLMLFNAWQHDTAIGYDAYAHSDYIEALSQFRRVTPEDSYEFFSPPLPYIVPAWAIALGNVSIGHAEKIAQFFNVLLSLGLTYFLLKICDIIHPSSTLKLVSLMCLGLLPVYYKTFAYVRGEPYVAFFAVLAVYLTLRIFQQRQVTVTNAVSLGFALGALALSRQWGILLFPAIGLFVLWQGFVYPSKAVSFLKAIALASVIAFLISGWFYLGLRADYGTATAFNRDPNAQFSLTNQPSSFYVDLAIDDVFSDPIRGNFPNRFFPIFYSETWGDYWGYFSVYGKDTRADRYLEGWELANELHNNPTVPRWLETNRFAIAPYLGRVNQVSLFPTALAIAAVGASLVTVVRRCLPDNSDRTLDWQRRRNQRDTLLLLLLAIATSMGGYFWFLIMYPNLGKGDTIKATYTLQIFPMLSIVTGYFLFRLKAWKPILFFLVLAGFAGVWVHNLPAMVTHYPALS